MAITAKTASIRRIYAGSAQLDDKTFRRVLVYGPSLMLVEFRFRKGGAGKMHLHEEHEQVGYMAKGSFEITVGGEDDCSRR